MKALSMNNMSRSGRTASIPSRVEARLRQRIRVHRGCWEYISPFNGAGNNCGYFSIGWREGANGAASPHFVLGVHEAAARLWLCDGGELKDGDEVHHECGNVGCFNPEHLLILGSYNHQCLHYHERFNAREFAAAGKRWPLGLR